MQTFHMPKPWLRAPSLMYFKHCLPVGIKIVTSKLFPRGPLVNQQSHCCTCRDFFAYSGIFDKELFTFKKQHLYSVMNCSKSSISKASSFLNSAESIQLSEAGCPLTMYKKGFAEFTWTAPDAIPTCSPPSLCSMPLSLLLGSCCLYLSDIPEFLSSGYH